MGNVCLNDVAANQDGEIVTVSDDGYVRLGRLTPTEARWVARVEPSSGRMLANAVTLDDSFRTVISGAHDQKLHLFEKLPNGFGRQVEVEIGEGPINCVRVSHHPGYEGRAFVACYSGAVVQVDLNGNIVHSARVHDGAVKALRLHPRLPLGVSCSADGSLCSWDLNGRLVQRFPGHMAIVDDVDIEPDGNRIVSVSRDFTAKIYDLHDGRLLHSFSLGRRSPKAVCFFDDTAVIVTNYWGSLLRIDLDSGSILTRPIAGNGISSIARMGGLLVVVSYDGVAYLVRPNDLYTLNSLRGMTQRLHPSELIQPLEPAAPVSA
jgi:WD40 repeat protein